MRKIALIFSLLVIVTSNAFSAPGKQIELMLQDSATGLASVADINFVAGTSPMFNSSEDGAFVLQSPDSIPRVFSFSQDNVACSLNAYGDFTSSVIVRLGVNLPAGGTFMLTKQTFANFHPASMLILEDRVLNTFTDLKQPGASYKITVAAATQFTGRFFLHINFPPFLTSSPAGCLNNDGIVFINEDSSLMWHTCKLLDTANNIVAIDTNVTGNFSFTGLPGGNYHVEFDYSVYFAIQNIMVDEHLLQSGLSVSNNHDRAMQNIQFFSGASNATQVNWDFGDGSTITGVANPTYYYRYPGIFTATVNCVNNYGCSAQSDTLMYIDNATAIDNIDGNMLKVITSNNNINIELDNNATEAYNYVVYDINGQSIKAGALSNSNTMLDMSASAAGVYIVTIKGNSSTLSEKVVITH